MIVIIMKRWIWVINSNHKVDKENKKKKRNTYSTLLNVIIYCIEKKIPFIYYRNYEM